ncbi:MAG: cbb3-type cytochrome c oxidase subunit 3 [Burkholderiales bacterium]|jgi:cytochrome c oxidase cbb3-type subunit IV|nr:cbb3-type cytochrome c oxidase subunit 3 [Burkholderiales bacterium]
MTRGDLQSIITLIAFVAFIGIVWWAYSKRQRAAFSEAERIPLDDDAPYRPSAEAKAPIDSGSREVR